MSSPTKECLAAWHLAWVGGYRLCTHRRGALGITLHSGLLRIFGVMSEVAPKNPEWEAGTWKA